MALLVVGAAVAVIGFLVLSAMVWVTALGIALLIISFLLLALARALPDVPPEVSLLLMETGADNIAAVVEELGINSRPVYLPSRIAGGRSRALIPLHSNASVPDIRTPLPQRLIVRYGPGADDIGLMVTTAGTAATGMLEAAPGRTAGELQAALTGLIRGRLGAADGVGVELASGEVTVEVYQPRIQNGTGWSHRCLDSSLASVVASVAAEAFDRPVTVTGERQLGKRYTIDLRVEG